MQSGSQYLGLELKYCERCGTLGLRHQGSSQIYCESCEETMANVYRERLVQRTKTGAEETCEAPEDGPGKKGSERVPPPFTAGDGESLDQGRWA